MDDAHKFVGLDAIDKVLAMDVDVVLLTTPPGFRAEHFEKAVAANKHAFIEKPIGTDGPSVRRFIAAADESKKKGLGAQSGFCWRSKYAERETQKRIRDGQIGEVRSTYGTYLANTPWVHPRQPGWTDLEYQLRNWMYFTWLSGDHIVEQAVHTVDKMCWTFDDVDPVSATAVGGRQQRVEDQYGHIYDHFGDAVRVPRRRALDSSFAGSRCRAVSTKWPIISSAPRGHRSTSVERTLQPHPQTVPGDSWKFDGDNNDMYQTEHDEFFASHPFQAPPLNNAHKMAHSTMVGIMGRMAAYTGQTITWEDAIASKESLRPEGPLTWDMKLPTPPVAIPGRTRPASTRPRSPMTCCFLADLDRGALAIHLRFGAAPPSTEEAYHLRKGVNLGLLARGEKGASVLDRFQDDPGCGLRRRGAPASANAEPLEEIRKARATTGLQNRATSSAQRTGASHSQSPDNAVREQGVRGLKLALKEAGELGCATVLLVPAVVNKDVSYADAYTRSQESIRSVLPDAEAAKVKIAIENVWNQFLLSPLEAARYVDEFMSPWVGWHFDIGNVITYGWPEQWVHITRPSGFSRCISRSSRARSRTPKGCARASASSWERATSAGRAVMKALDAIELPRLERARSPRRRRRAPQVSRRTHRSVIRVVAGEE